MPIKLKINFGSPIFKAGRARTRIVTTGLVRKAKRFKRWTVAKMEDGPQTGRYYRRRSGPGFTRLHRASRVNQYPAVDTGALIRSFKDRRLTAFSHAVYSDAGHAAPLVAMQRIVINQKSMNDFQQEEGKKDDDKIMRELLGI